MAAHATQARTLLLSGFDIWGEEPYNSSWESLHAMQFSPPPGWRLRRARLPVVWAEIDAALNALLEEAPPDAVLCFGMSPRATVDLERIAVNFCDAAGRDAAGSLPPGEYVRAGGPAAYFDRLPRADILAALGAEGIPARISAHAGTFLCNYLFYSLMHRLEQCGRRIPAGFIHVPHFAPEGGLPRAQIGRAMEIIAACTIAHAAHSA